MTSAKPSMAPRIAAWAVLSVLAFAAWLAWPRLERAGTPLATGSPVAGDPGAINLEQGWSAQAQENAWFTSFGSRLLPHAWFLHLEQADSGTLFRDDAHL